MKRETIEATSRRRRWRTLRAAGLSLSMTVGPAGGLALAHGTAGASTAARWQLVQSDQDVCWDYATLDVNFDGVTDQLAFTDANCRWDLRFYVAGGRTWLAADRDVNGREDLWFDGRTSYFDVNGDGRWDRRTWAATPPPIPTPRANPIDAGWMARSVVAAVTPASFIPPVYHPL